MNKNIIFIVGASRSGTTMLSEILGRHSIIHTFEELHFFEEIFSINELGKPISRREAIKIYARLLQIERAQGYFLKKFDERFFAISKKIVEYSKTKNFTKELIFKKFISNETQFNNKDIACEQTPSNAYYIQEILNIFPEAKIIAIIRDPRDVLLSQKKRWKVALLGERKIPFSVLLRVWLNYNPILISKLWKSSNATILKYRNSKKLLVIKYEELLNAPQETVQKIDSFIGVKYENEQLNIPIRGSSIVKEKPFNMGIDKTRKGNWYNGLSKTEIYICEKQVSALMDYLDYKKSNPTPNYIVLFGYYLLVPIKLVLGLFFNIKKFNSLLLAVKKRFL